MSEAKYSYITSGCEHHYYDPNYKPDQTKPHRMAHSDKAFHSTNVLCVWIPAVNSLFYSEGLYYSQNEFTMVYVNYTEYSTTTRKTWDEE